MSYPGAHLNDVRMHQAEAVIQNLPDHILDDARPALNELYYHLRRQDASVLLTSL